MANTSATGGPLVPSSTTPVEDDAFEDLIGNTISGLTGITRGMVRPRWQPTPPPMPPDNVSWCAFGIMELDADWGAHQQHHPEGDGSTELTRHETLTMLASFYGPNGYSKASQLRDGLWIKQNWDSLNAAGVALLECSRARTATDIVNERYIRKIDLEMQFRRVITRTYPILNLLSAQGSFTTDTGHLQPFIVEN
ncbi:hypothetical protein AB6806_27490 [Bosea sp. RCC_152_1]|uniref:phage neck terminator protein n=1 Tax=Bosea sp. RCC_152_1 TaxID=3239228 RepID=UPI0035249F6F